MSDSHRCSKAKKEETLSVSASQVCVWKELDWSSPPAGNSRNKGLEQIVSKEDRWMPTDTLLRILSCQENAN